MCTNTMDLLKDKIPDDVFQRLQTVGIESLEYFILESKQEICDKTKLSKRDVNHLVQFVSELNLIKTCIKTALDLKKENDYSAFISLGCPQLDSKIKGIPLRGITEVYGESSTGKTQLLLQVTLNVNDGSIYICTEGIFPSKRLEELLVHSSKDAKHKMDNVYVERIRELEQLKYCIDIKIPVLVSRTRINLIVIDSITAIFRYDKESNDYISRSEDLIYLTKKLNEISREYNIAIVCVNQVTTDPDHGLKPCLGLSWSNLIRKRIQLSRNGNDHRRMKVVFAPDTARNEISYVIRSEGVKGL